MIERAVFVLFCAAASFFLFVGDREAALIVIGLYVALILSVIEEHLRNQGKKSRLEPKERPNPLVGSAGRRGDRRRL